MSELPYIGLMSGTSLDAVDAALVDFTGPHPDVLATREHAFPPPLLNRLNALVRDGAGVTLEHVGQLDRELGDVYADACEALLADAHIDAARVAAIGCHGQTVCHRPDLDPPFTLQLGDAATLAARTGIQVVNDFRRADIAVGGQGAPLAPAFHDRVFRAQDRARVILNLGGIANISVLPPDTPATGFDTGPANTLLDVWCGEHLGKRYDAEGAWAASGTPDETLLESMLLDPYFAAAPPKSTGREYFNKDWLSRHLSAFTEAPGPADVQATLAELTARSVADAIARHAPGAEVFVCGGGAFNADLLRRLATHLPDGPVATTADLGVPPEWVEAAAFAWLARARLRGEPGNLPSVTGARRPALLGALHLPPEA